MAKYKNRSRKRKVRFGLHARSENLFNPNAVLTENRQINNVNSCVNSDNPPESGIGNNENCGTNQITDSTTSENASAFASSFNPYRKGRIVIPWDSTLLPPSCFDYDVVVDMYSNNPFYARPQNHGTFPVKPHISTNLRHPVLSEVNYHKSEVRRNRSLPRLPSNAPYMCMEELFMFAEFREEWNSFRIAYSKFVEHKPKRKTPLNPEERCITEDEKKVLFERVLTEKPRNVFNFFTLRVHEKRHQMENNCCEKYGPLWRTAAPLKEILMIQRAIKFTNLERRALFKEFNTEYPFVGHRRIHKDEIVKPKSDQKNSSD